MGYKNYFCFLVLVFSFQASFAQYTVNGNAARLSCNEYRLTSAQNFLSGSVWNNNRIDLTQSFNFNFDVILGSNDSPGADGIAFVLQPISTSVGSSGGGLGYDGITPAVGVTIDTYQNGPDGDPAFDHIAVQLNGNLNHNSTNNIAGPVTAINGNGNIEDGNWHSLRIEWNTLTKTLTAYVDGVLRLSAVKDFVAEVFGGNPSVFWGFTGSTGGENNYQGFKTALNPAYVFNAGQKRCVNEPITFKDSTVSFTPIIKFYWDFGDGSPIDSVNLNPVHTYTSGGDYMVRQRVIGADGCEAINDQPLRIGTKPVAAIRVPPNYNHCFGQPTNLFDSSYADFGTINTWYWNLDDGISSTLQNPVVTHTTPGYKNLRLAVTSLEGCQSDTIERILVKSGPIVDFYFTDSVCLGQPTSFYDSTKVLPNGNISSWTWSIDGNSINTQNPTYTFATAGVHSVSLQTVTDNNCAGVKIKNVFVADKPRAAFRNSFICQSVSTTLSDSSFTTDGTAITSYWWDLGNGQFSTQQNPQVTYINAGPITIKHVVTNARGCVSDTIEKNFDVKPVPDAVFNFNNACRNDVVNFTASDNNGLVTRWEWSFGDGQTASTQNPQHVYADTGTYRVVLVGIAPGACYNDTLRSEITIYGTNAFAGNDTITPSGRPLQLQATGGISYEWQPATGLSNPNIANPIATLTGTQIYTYVVRAFTPIGCESFDTINIQVYQAPEIYLPNAFTPDGNGVNDVYRASLVGIRDFKYLRIFNRYGQEVFATTDPQKGWDGTYKAKLQNSGVYVVIASGLDYRGLPVERKSTVMLIR